MVHSAIYNKIFAKKKSLVGGSASLSSFSSLLFEKKDFLIKVFANLIVQLGITYFVMMNFPEIKMSASIFWGLLILEIIIILTLAMGKFPAWIKFILFTAFSICSGIMLSFTKQTVNSNLIQLALVGTIGIFGIMFLIGAFLIFSGIKLGIQFASFLFFALLFLFLFQLMLLFTRKMAVYIKVVSIISLCIFSLYIIYDTNNILQRNYNGDFITASLDYYLDVLNIFVDLLNLFSSNT